MRHQRSSATRFLALLALVAITLVALAPAALARDRSFHDRSFRDRSLRDGTFTVTHGPVTITLGNPASDGHQLGDLRVTSVPIADESGADVGRLDSTLTTVGIDTPNPGDEIRISVLIFSFQEPADQLVVQGTAIYPKAGPTIATNTTVQRPITGGSGIYAGATGWAETEHLADGSWRHTFHLTDTGWRGIPDRPLVREGWSRGGDRWMHRLPRRGPTSPETKPGTSPEASEEPLASTAP